MHAVMKSVTVVWVWRMNGYIWKHSVSLVLEMISSSHYSVFLTVCRNSLSLFLQCLHDFMSIKTFRASDPLYLNALMFGTSEHDSTVVCCIMSARRSVVVLIHQEVWLNEMIQECLSDKHLATVWTHIHCMLITIGLETNSILYS